jgi:hypothetical protein
MKPNLIMGLHGWLIWKMPVTTLIVLKVSIFRFEESEEITAVSRGFRRTKL